MNTLKFKTNINCGGCVAKLTPFLDAEKGISDWKVDTEIPEKILTVENLDMSQEQIIEIVKKAGFNIQLMDEH